MIVRRKGLGNAEDGLIDGSDVVSAWTSTHGWRSESGAVGVALVDPTSRLTGETDNEYAARMSAMSQQQTVSMYKSATMWLGVALVVTVAGAFFLKR